MKIKKTITTITILATVTISNAASTFVGFQKVNTDQVHLRNETAVDGSITAFYEGTTTELFTFDTQNDTRSLTSIDLTYGTTQNKYTVYKQKGIEYLGEAKLEMFANVYMYDVNNALIFNANDVNYQNNRVNNANNPINNFESRDYTISFSPHAYGFTNAAVLDALENGGVRFEIQERAVWTVKGLDGNSIATDLHSNSRLEKENFINNNDYNFNIGFFAEDIASVPEPSSTALIGLGGLALILRRRTR